MTPAVDRFDYGALLPPQAKALRTVAEKICRRTAAITSAIIETGRDLVVAKHALAHGQFSQWVEAECGFTHRTGQNYMRVAQFADGKSETVSLLAPSSIYALASKAAPPDAVHEVLQRLDSGLVPTDSDVKQLLAAAVRKIEPACRKPPNPELGKEEADDLAAQLLETVGPGFARLLAEGPWDQIGVALRAKLHAGVASSSDQCRSAANVAPTSTDVDLERDPHDANLYRPKSSESDSGGIPPFLDRRTRASRATKQPEQISG